MQNYAEIIKQSGLKATFQRMTILSVIDELGHASIDEIYEGVKRTHPTLSLATVYKNILTMVSHSVLTEVPIAGKKSKYEIKKGEHIHLVCTDCGAVIDIESNLLIKDALKKLSEEMGFKMDESQINIYGICQKCNMKEVS
jgi:Fur family ferric uptake transcriptional regulator/Fur family peroxide stress response transcriptional regulator